MVYSKGIDKAELLIGLYDNSHQQGFGMFQPEKQLTIQEAKEVLKQTTSFDYLFGKVMKVDLGNDESFEERLYDRDNGKGRAQRVVNNIRAQMLQNATTEEERAEIMEQDRISREFYAKQEAERKTKEKEYYEQHKEEIDRAVEQFRQQLIDTYNEEARQSYETKTIRR